MEEKSYVQHEQANQQINVIAKLVAEGHDTSEIARILNRRKEPNLKSKGEPWESVDVAEIIEGFGLSSAGKQVRELADVAPSVSFIDTMRWAVFYGSTLVLYSMFSGNDPQWSVGFVTTPFIIGLVISSILWMFFRQWKWYDWMNVGSYLGTALFLVNLSVRHQ